MPFVTDDEIASGIFAVSDWTALTDVDRRLLRPIHDGVEAALTIWLGDNTSLAERTEIITLPDIGFPKHSLPVDETIRGVEVIYLKHTPVTVAGLVIQEQRHELAAWSADHNLVSGSDYQLEDVVGGISRSGMLRRIGGSPWPSPPGAVRATYTGGWSESANPNEWQLLKMAVLAGIREHYQTAKRHYAAKGEGAGGPLASESIGKYSMSVDTQSVNLGGLTGTSTGGVTPTMRAILSDLIDYSRFF